MKERVHPTRLYLQSGQPMLLSGETDTERRALAESIHNTGFCNEGPFLALPCAGLAREEQEGMFFGSKGAVFLVEGGALYLEGAKILSLKSQYGLYQLLRYKTGSRDFTRTTSFHIRAIASSILALEDLGNLVFLGGSRQGLYCLFTGLALRVSSLRERPEDLEQVIGDAVREACSQYSRYHVVTQGGMQCLKAYLWQRNLLQLETFLKQLILVARRRSVNETLVRKLLRELLPSSVLVRMMLDGQGIGGPVACEKKRQIRLALVARGGSRERVAACLGTSKATL